MIASRYESASNFKIPYIMYFTKANKGQFPPFPLKCLEGTYDRHWIAMSIPALSPAAQCPAPAGPRVGRPATHGRRREACLPGAERDQPAGPGTRLREGGRRGESELERQREGRGASE